MSVAAEESFCLSQVCVYIAHVRRRRKSKNPNTLSTQHSLILLNSRFQQTRETL